MTMLKNRSARRKIKSQNLASGSTTSGAAVTSSAGAAESGIVKRYHNVQQQISSRWHVLPARDKLALTILFLFLVLFVGGYGGYSIHSAATKSKADYNKAVSDYFWLRSQAGNIDADANAASQSDASEPPTTAVTTVLSQAGINEAQVVAAGEGVQLSFTHDSQALVGRVLNTLQQQGWAFSRLSVQQDSASKILQVQATLIR